MRNFTINSKLLINRSGGFGDNLLWSATLPFLFKKYKSISLDLCTHGYQLFWNDPRFEYIHYFEPRTIPIEERNQKLTEHRESLSSLYPDHDILDFHYSIEGHCITYDVAEDAELSQEERAAKYSKNFYDAQFEFAKVAMPEGWRHRNTIFFSREETDAVERWRNRAGDYFVLILVLGGSSIQKVFPTWMKGFCRRLIRELPKLKIYLMGDNQCRGEGWECERTINLIEKVGFKQSLHMTKYADYVLGSETGLLIGAGMFGTPKTALCTISAVDQCFNYHENDFSLQSKSKCSPCHMLAYSGRLCPKEPVYNNFPICTHEWDRDEIFSLIAAQYRKWRGTV